MTHIQISNPDDMVRLLGGRSSLRCFIQLNFGGRSVKRIRYDRRRRLFNVLNQIDGSRQMLSADQIMDTGLTNIGEAMRLGAFYAELPEESSN